MSTDTIEVVRGRPDEPGVRALLAALDDYLAGLYPPEANHILDLDALCAPEVDFVVARAGGRVVGCGAARRMAAEDATAGLPYGEIKRMMVDADWRAQGIGGRVLAALEQGLRAQGIGQALLETGADQHAALRLYQRCGYRRRGPFGGYPDNGLSHFYAKVLGA